jgi:signal transduction histidine kinase
MNMFGIRLKLLLGFGGLLAILVAVGLVGRWSLQRFSGTLEQVFHENYDSVVYGQNMLEALDGLDEAAQSILYGALVKPTRTTADFTSEFDDNLARESNNVTLPGEADLVIAARAGWATYRAEFDNLSKLPEGDARRAHYRDVLFPKYVEVKKSAQRIIDINVKNMGLQNGVVKASAARVETTLYALVGSGILMGVVFVALLAHSILTPLRAVTESASEIERGNLDLIVPVHSRDEVGQLAETFNRMAGRLRELRRTDRAKLVRTQRTTALALGSLPDAVAIVSPEGRVEVANNAAQKLFGLTVGRELSAVAAGGDASHPYDPTGLSDLFRQAVKERHTIQSKGYDAAIQIFNGSERFFLPTAVPIIDEENVLAGVTLTLADVTNLRKLDEMKSGLLSVVSHELKTPLTSIRMATHLLLEERVGPINPKQTELLTAAREEADRLYEIIENLLDMGRIESGRALLEAKLTPAEDLVRRAVEEVLPAFRDRGITLISDVPADCGDVLADAARVSHVFSNLLGNALKYSLSGSTVSLRAVPDRDAVKFVVADSGAGIPAADLPHVFERFFRAANQQAGQQGAGLGLAIAREIVEASGGKIGVESAVGGGSRFWFTLPRTAEEPTHETHSREHHTSEVRS